MENVISVILLAFQHVVFNGVVFQMTRQYGEELQTL
jgi:hypothetical protein